MDQATTQTNAAPQVLAHVATGHRIVLLSGKQGAGKTTLANALTEMAPRYGYRPYRTRFAKTLYEIHNAARDTARRYGIPWPDKYGPFLQQMGTELGRNRFGENVWVDALRADVERELAAATQPTLVVIDDLRFKNEFDVFADGAPEGADVLRLRLECHRDTRRLRADSWRDDEHHPSETDLDTYVPQGRFTAVISTPTGTIEGMVDHARSVVFPDQEVLGGALGNTQSLSGRSETATA